MYQPPNVLLSQEDCSAQNKIESMDKPLKPLKSLYHSGHNPPIKKRRIPQSLREKIETYSPRSSISIPIGTPIDTIISLQDTKSTLLDINSYKNLPNYLPLYSKYFSDNSQSQKTIPTKLCPKTPRQVDSAKICRMDTCNKFAVKRSPYCDAHRGVRKCEYIDGCAKVAQGRTRFCIAHGGGRRCTHPSGCNRAARDKLFCAAHGGGKRCTVKGCHRLALVTSKSVDIKCTAHGGGKRCLQDGCAKSAQSGTNFCVKHGGGKRCRIQGCQKVARGKTMYCMSHGRKMVTSRKNITSWPSGLLCMEIMPDTNDEYGTKYQDVKHQ